MGQNISVIGCGYVGLTTAVILANSGYTVRAVEVHPERLASLQDGKSFFFEAGVNELLTKALEQKTLVFSDDIAASLPESDIVFCCVGTPDNPDGSSNLSYVFTAAEQFAAHAQAGAIFVQKSTVPVGTGSKIETMLTASDKNFSYVSNPEFLRESTAISDTLWADRIVVGSANSEAATAITKLYETIENKQYELAEIARITPVQNAKPTQYFKLSLASAELVKVSSNAFLALKISFANSIAQLADASDADVVEVMDAVGADNRIGRAFLNAGRGYGGGCFPKDVSGLIRSSQDYGVAMPIMEAASSVNASMPQYIVEKVEERCGQLQDKKVTVLGLAFKSGTSDTRKSPAVAIANLLVARGTHVTVYDPEALHEARSDLNENVTAAETFETAIQNAEIIFIGTDWTQFLDTQALDAYANASVQVIVDCMNRLPANTMQNKIIIGVGRD